MPRTWVKSHKRDGKIVKGHFKSVKSGNIKSYHYDPELLDLKIRFKTATKDGANTYVYADVPEKVVEQFENAESPGKFFYHKIRSKFNYSKLK